MPRVDRATSWRLIDAECQKLVESIGSLKKLPRELGEGSRSLIVNQLKMKIEDVEGPRSNMWLLRSATNHANYRPRDDANVWIKWVRSWVKKAEENPDSWIVASVVHCIGVLSNAEPDFLDRLKSKGLKVSELRKRAISRLKVEIVRLKKENHRTNDVNARFKDTAKKRGSAYIAYWLYEALATTDSAEGKKIIQSVDWMVQIDKELAAAQVSTMEVNPIELASVTALAVLAGQCEKEGSRQSRHCDAAIELLTRIQDWPIKRNVIHDGVYRFLDNLPFEELLILAHAAPHRFPAVLRRIETLIDFLTPRLQVIEPSGRGVTDDSAPQYPEVAPYVTGYMGVLTESLLRPLRSSLKRRLAERFQERNLPGHAGPVGQPLETFLDCEERTYETLRGALANCIVSGSMDFKMLSSANTILLFGPPGTGKTTIAEQLTSFLTQSDTSEPNDPWYLLSLTPSVFLVSDSFSELLENIENIFSALLEIERSVFFFDEAEELMRSRDKDESRIGRLFTGAMLIHLNELKKARSVSIFATNFIDLIDDAASRVGRFAFRKGVGAVALDDVKDYVDRELGAKSRQERDIVKECLRGRVGMEVVKLCSKLAKCSSVVDKEFFDNHRPIISEENLSTHKKNVKKYDAQ